jgi:fatty-acyl-CoA synthase
LKSETIARNLIRSYREAPDQPAINLLFSKQPDELVTYRALIEGAAGFAQALEDKGVQPGEVVILILNHGTALVEAFFGTILQGAIPSIMPFLTEKLAPEHYRSSLKSLFEITSPAAVITLQDYLDEVQQACQDSSSIRTVLLGEAIKAQAHPNLEHFSGYRQSPMEIALLQHSSGTTGLQKGVALSHQAIFNQIEHYSQTLHLNREDVIVSWLPLYHDMGLIAGFILPILKRIPLVLMSPFDWVRAPYKLMQAVSEYRGTLSWLPNFAYNFCAQKIRDRDLVGIDLSSWRAVINCSEPMYWGSHVMFQERFQPYGLGTSALATCYAMAENVFAVSQSSVGKSPVVDLINQDALLTRQVAEPAVPDSQAAIKLLSAGKPLANTSLKILDQNGQALVERQIGEIAIKSDCMLTGYFNRPDLTSNAFLNGWYLTGDLGYLADGELYVTGRKKDLIIVGGKNIYPQDLERLAGQVDGVYPGRLVAFGVFNEQAGTEDVAIVAEIDSQNSPLAPETWDEQAARLAANIRQSVKRGSDIAVRYVKIVERNWLLKTSSGKIARSANRDKFLSVFNEELVI